MKTNLLSALFHPVSPEAQAIRQTQAVIEFDANGTILDANPLFLNAVGYTIDEIRGKHHAIFMDPAERERPAYKNFWERLGRGEAVQDQFLRIAKGGRQVWLQAIYTPIPDKAGKITRVIKFATDITDHKNMVAELEGQLAAINKSQAVIEFDLSGKILRANANFLKAVGYAEEEIVGRHHGIFVDAQTRESPAYAEFWRKLARGEYQEGQYLRLGKGGRTIWLQASYNPILDALGQPWKVVKYASDITLAKAEGDLRGAVAQTRAVVEAAMKQDLTQRIDVDGLGGDVLALCSGVNDLVESYAGLVGSITTTVSDLNDTSREISSAAHDLSKRTEEQAASLEETAATTEELAASVKSTSQASQQATSLAADAMHEAESGGAIAEQAVKAMSRIEESSAKISEISRVIDDIAFQTNLLALNAAVEAARAGEAGKGFAVVASEVRTLAQRSGAAAKDIFALVASAQSEIGAGVELVERAGHALEAILASSRKVASNIASISTATGEQAHGVDEVSLSVTNMDTITQANASLAEESAASATILSEKAARLHELVRSYRIGSASLERRSSAFEPSPNHDVARLRDLAAKAFSQSKVEAPPPRRAAAGQQHAGWAEF